MAELLNNKVTFGVATHSPSGGFSKAADELPRFWVYEEESDSPLIAYSEMTLRTGTVGTYRGQFNATTGLGFEAQKRYEVWVSGLVEGINGHILAKTFFLELNNFDTIGTGNIPVNVVQLQGASASGNNGLFRSDMVRINDTPISGVNEVPSNVTKLQGVAASGNNGLFMTDVRLLNGSSLSGVGTVDANIVKLNGVPVSGVDGITLASGNFVYYADVRFHKDTSNTRDEWSCQWYRNDGPLGSGAITTPIIQVVNVTTGTDLIASSGMSYVSINVGTVKYYENTNRTTAGENYIAKFSATIDGTTHNWQKLVGRDS